MLFPSLIKVVETDSTPGTPAISTYVNYAILRNGSSTLKAYDFTTGTQIQNWSIVTPNLPEWPPPMIMNTTVIPSWPRVYMTVTDFPNLAGAPTHTLGRIYAAALTVGMVYVLGESGVYALDSDLNLQSFAPIPQGNGGGLAVLANGSLVVASRNGMTYIFPAN